MRRHNGLRNRWASSNAGVPGVGRSNAPRSRTDAYTWLVRGGMSETDVEAAVRSVARTAEEHGCWLAGNETALRYALVDPILRGLGWDISSPRQCLPQFRLGHRGIIDYALFEPQGSVAVLVLTGTTPACLRAGRRRLESLARGMNRGMAVLTYGTMWEIYNLRVRSMKFRDKLVERLDLDRNMNVEPEDIAHALHRRIRQDLWWSDPP